MATVKDVARAAGVSLGTVSNVLNGRSSVLPENREKVYQAMEKLGFQYNMTASALRTKSTKNIGLVIPTIVNPYYPELARGVEDGAREVGFTVFLCNSDRKVEKERQYIDALLSRGVDGLILVKTRLPKEELDQLKSLTALVLVDYSETSEESFYTVNVDDEAGVIQGMELLLRHGHSRIAFISGYQDAYSSRCRIQAYRDFLEKNKIPYRAEYVIQGDYGWNSGYSAAKKFLSLDVAPTAIFAANDVMAMGAIKAILAAGLRVPEDVSVVGYDDIEMSCLSTPALTTIHQPKYRVGIESVRLLVQNMNGQIKDEMQILMATEIVQRESVAKVQ